MGKQLRVDEPSPVFRFLVSHLDGWHRNTVRQRIQQGSVQVNGRTVTRPDHALTPGDVVEVLDRAEVPVAIRATHGFAVLHVDDDWIAVDKRAGILSVSTGRSSEQTVLALVKSSLSRPGRPARVWPVHRLDRETSGVLLLARSRAICDAVQESWHEARKVYLAIVEGTPRDAEGCIDEPLREDKNLDVRVGDHPDARAARTRYRTLRSENGRTLLEVELDTGRRHQIRAHLAWIRHPVVGDPRYGSGGARMALHALRLELPHPTTRLPYRFEAPPSHAFSALLGSGRRR
jgi:23S rRNA pseudouridine1911/1915/1917 synthase